MSIVMSSRSHPTWVRGLKQEIKAAAKVVFKSHPTWVRGLKHICLQFPKFCDASHPTWVRGLKLKLTHSAVGTIGRTLRGCVD